MRSAIVVAAISVASSISAFAHHSSSRFDLEKTVELVGVVTRLVWANPGRERRPCASGLLGNCSRRLSSPLVLTDAANRWWLAREE